MLSKSARFSLKSKPKPGMENGCYGWVVHARYRSEQPTDIYRFSRTKKAFKVANWQVFSLMISQLRAKNRSFSHLHHWKKRRKIQSRLKKQTKIYINHCRTTKKLATWQVFLLIVNHL